MFYTLDTNFVSQLLKGNQNAVENLENALEDGHEVSLNAVCYYEVKRGLILPTFRKKLEVFEELAEEYDVLSLDMLALDEAIRIYQDLRQKGTPIEDADLLMGAIANTNDAILVTHNTKHFGRIAGLSFTDWQV